MEDWNSRVGNNIKKGSRTMGEHGGETVINENGKRVIQFCKENNLKIGNTFFAHKRKKLFL